MGKRKKVLLLGTFIAVLVVFGLIMLALHRENADKMSKYEWIQMLSESFGLSEYSSDTPYFNDVDEENQYFECVQASYEWGILDKTAKFDGEKRVTGKFAALTAMKAIGKYKVQIYLDKTEEPTDSDYLNVAIEKGIVKKSLLRKNISPERGKEIASKASEVYLDGLWVDDLCDIHYENDVKEVESKNIVYIQNDYSEIKVLKKIADTFTQGDKIVFKDSFTGQDVAKVIASVDEDGVIELEDAELDNIVNSMVLSDISSLSADDIANYYKSDAMASYGAENIVMASAKKENYDAVPMFATTGHSDGISIILGTEDGTLALNVVDNASQLTLYQRTFKEDMKFKGIINAQVNVSRIDVGVQGIYTEDNGLEYVNAQVESDITCSGNVSIDGERRIPLMKAPIYLGDGRVGVDLYFYLAISAEGEFSIETTIPMSYAIDYEKGVGARTHPNIGSFGKPEIQVNCSASCSLSTEPVLKLLFINILDLEADIGVTVDASAQNHTDSDVIACLDAKIYAPIVTISLSGDDSKKTLLKLLDVSGEWSIINKDNAPFTKQLHYERYKGGTGSFVDQCTYGKKSTTTNKKTTNKKNTSEKKKDTTTEEENEIGYDQLGEYMAVFDSAFVDKGKYYTVTGSLYHSDYIPADTVENMKIGDTYKFYHTEYIFLGKVTSDELYGDRTARVVTETDEFYKFTDNSNNIYFICGEPFTVGNDGIEVYMMYVLGDGVTTGVAGAPVNTLIEGKYTFEISKDAFVDIPVSSSSYDEYGESYDYEMYTAEDCFKKKIKDYRGSVLTKDMRTPVAVQFDADGMVNSLTPNPLPEEYYSGEFIH